MTLTYLPTLHVYALLLVGILSLSFCGIVQGKGLQPFYGKKKPPSCPLGIDFSTTETTLRSLIFLARTKEAAQVLNRNETFSLGAGLQFLEKQRCAVIKTDNPQRDPDIVAIQAIALSAKYTRDTVKLANAVALSFESKCKYSLFTPAEKDRIVDLWKGFLEDPKELRLILEFDGEDEDAASNSKTSDDAVKETSTNDRRRLLQQTTPTNSLLCALCRPKRNCGEFSWCREK